jgi:hypothetical protein
MYRMELALIIVMGVNNLHARFIRLFHLYIQTFIYFHRNAPKRKEPTRLPDRYLF